MINLKDKVKSKNTKGSFQCLGEVVGFYDPIFFIKFYKFNDWDKNYPSWREKPVAVVEFDEYKKSATLEEWIDSAVKKGISKEAALSNYDQCPITNIVMVPCDDLEKIEV